MSCSGSTVTFTLRTPAHIKSCHVTGSWDNYGKRYAMTLEASAAGFWTVSVNFGSALPEGRSWYYFILDGYFESHDPNRPTCVEPARKLTLNILDYSVSRSVSPDSAYEYETSSPVNSKRSGGFYARRERSASPRRVNSELPHLVHPKPRNPLMAHQLTLDTPAPYSPSASPVSAYSGPATPIEYDDDCYYSSKQVPSDELAYQLERSLRF